MITRILTRRLERIEAGLAPPDDEPALVIHLTERGTPRPHHRSAWDWGARLPATSGVSDWNGGRRK